MEGSEDTTVEAIQVDNDLHQYSAAEAQFIASIAEEASDLFPEGKLFPSPAALRDELREFAHRKGFVVTSDGTSIRCSRFAETNALKNRRARRIASDVVPPEKRRIYRSSTRCGCPFRILFSFVDRKNCTQNKQIRLLGSSYFKHDNGCTPSRAQLVVEKRKAGTYTTAINDTQIKTILALMKTKRK